MKGKLFINNQEIDKWSSENDTLEDDSLCISVHDYILIDKKNVEKVVLEMDKEDCNKLEELMRIDGDRYLGKKIKIVIQVLGNVKPGR